MQEQHFLGRWVAMTYRATHMYMAERLKKLKISYGQFPFLCFLNRTGPASQEQISQALFFDKGTTARAVQKLEEQGYVERHSCPEDQRRNIVSITEAGQKCAVEIKLILKEWNSALTTNMSEEEKKIALKLLTALADNAAETMRSLSKKQADRRNK